MQTTATLRPIAPYVPWAAAVLAALALAGAILSAVLLESNPAQPEEELAPDLTPELEAA